MSAKNSGFEALKVALYSSVVAYVLMGALAPFTQEPQLGLSAAASRQVLIFFCLTALALVLFSRASVVKLGLGLLLLSAGVEAVQLIPLLERNADLLDVVAAGAGVLIATAPVTIGRQFPLQPKGSSPTSLSFLP